MTPNPDEHVMAKKMPSAGRIRVHGFRFYRHRVDNFARAKTDCGRSEDGSRAWLWVEFRSLNPEKVVLCKRCWGQPDEYPGADHE